MNVKKCLLFLSLIACSTSQIFALKVLDEKIIVDSSGLVVHSFELLNSDSVSFSGQLIVPVLTDSAGNFLFSEKNYRYPFSYCYSFRDKIPHSVYIKYKENQYFTDISLEAKESREIMLSYKVSDLLNSSIRDSFVAYSIAGINNFKQKENLKLFFELSDETEGFSVAPEYSFLDSYGFFISSVISGSGSVLSYEKTIDGNFAVYTSNSDVNGLNFSLKTKYSKIQLAELLQPLILSNKFEITPETYKYYPYLKDFQFDFSVSLKPQVEASELLFVLKALDFFLEKNCTRYCAQYWNGSRSMAFISQYALNLIAACSGYEFSTDYWKNYFESQTWYQPGKKLDNYSEIGKLKVKFAEYRKLAKSYVQYEKNGVYIVGPDSIMDEKFMKDKPFWMYSEGDL